MKYVSVSSSNIRAVGYDPNTLTLGVQFLTGTEYQYNDVPQHVYDGFFQAGSVGRYFNQHVKTAGYPYTRIR